MVFVDVDGVLLDFLGGLRELSVKTNIPVEELTGTYWPISPQLKRHCTWGFWNGLKPLPWANELLNVLERLVGIDDVFLVTSHCWGGGIAYPPGALDGKLDSISQHFHRYRRKVVFCTDREAIGSRGALLIDDCEANCQAFRKAGGSAVLWPAPVNHRHGEVSSWTIEQAVTEIGSTDAVLTKVRLQL